MKKCWKLCRLTKGRIVVWFVVDSTDCVGKLNAGSCSVIAPASPHIPLLDLERHNATLHVSECKVAAGLQLCEGKSSEQVLQGLWIV